MTGGSPQPTCVIPGRGKLRNGLFLAGIVFHDDRVAFEVFASRPIFLDDLASLRLSDDVGTNYEIVLPETGVVDGKAQIEFVPAVPDRWSQLNLSEPGWGLVIFKQRD